MVGSVNFYAIFKFCVEKYIYKNLKIAEKELAGGKGARGDFGMQPHAHAGYAYGQTGARPLPHLSHGFVLSFKARLVRQTLQGGRVYPRFHESARYPQFAKRRGRARGAR